MAHFTVSQRSHWLTLFVTLSLAHRPSLAEPSLANTYSHCMLPVTHTVRALQGRLRPLLMDRELLALLPVDLLAYVSLLVVEAVVTSLGEEGEAAAVSRPLPRGGRGGSSRLSVVLLPDRSHKPPPPNVPPPLPSETRGSFLLVIARRPSFTVGQQ